MTKSQTIMLAIKVLGTLFLLVLLAVFLFQGIAQGFPDIIKETPSVRAEFAGILAIVIGLFLGLKWPRIAAAIILSGVMVFHTIESKVWINWVFGLFDLTGVLHLIGGDIAMRGKQKVSARIMALLAVILIVIFSCGASYAAKRFTPTGKLGLQFVNESASAEYIVIVTHGWIEKGKGKWPQDIAIAISHRVDLNDWLCAYYDWSKGAATIDPTDAAQYARDVAGAAIAGQVLALPNKFRHIHLIGHSSGAWAISEAAKIIANNTDADIHLTFCDAFVPAGWPQQSLGLADMPSDANYWADQYYTRDFTLKYTEQNLDHAHNIDVTEIDQLIKDHNFPWKWYYATITGSFPKFSLIDDSKLVTDVNGLEYGFIRGLEAGKENWEQSLTLKMGNDAVKFRKSD